MDPELLALLMEWLLTQQGGFGGLGNDAAQGARRRTEPREKPPEKYKGPHLYEDGSMTMPFGNAYAWEQGWQPPEGSREVGDFDPIPMLALDQGYVTSQVDPAPRPPSNLPIARSGDPYLDEYPQAINQYNKDRQNVRAAPQPATRPMGTSVPQAAARQIAQMARTFAPPVPVAPRWSAPAPVYTPPPVPTAPRWAAPAPAPVQAPALANAVRALRK